MKGTKTVAALLVYCILFSITFTILYPIYADDKNIEIVSLGEPRENNIPARPNKAAHVLNVVEQRQVLGLYEDSKSLSSQQAEPQYV